MINNALNWILNGPDKIQGSEFHTVIGVEREEAVGLLRQVHDLIQSIAPAGDAPDTRSEFFNLMQ